jgi:transcriptional regulator with XRE-family HTH domain
MKKYNSVHDDKLNKVIGKNIRKIRKKNNYSSIMLCSELGISFSTLSNIERGVHATKLIHLDKMAELFNVSHKEFFEEGG